MSSNTYGYIADTGPTQAYGSNNGVFNPADINDLIAENKWSGVGTLELIQTQTSSGAVAQVDFTSIKEDIYNIHLVTFNNFQPVNDTPSFLIRFFESGVIESGSVYQNAYQKGATDGTFGEDKSTGQNGIAFGGAQTTDTGGAINGYFYIYNAGDSTKYTFLTAQSMDLDKYSGGYFYYGSSVLPQVSVVDGFRFLYSSGNIADFDVSLYGIKEY